MGFQAVGMASAYIPDMTFPITRLSSPADKTVYASEVSKVTIQWTARAYDDTPSVFRIYVDGIEKVPNTSWSNGQTISYVLAIDGTFRTYKVECKAYSRSSYDTDIVYVRVRIRENDYDGDGLSNTVEINLGTNNLNPNDPDWIVESFDQENVGDQPYYDWDNHKGDHMQVDYYPSWEPRSSDDHLLKSTQEKEWIDKDIEDYVDDHSTGNDYFYFSFDLAVDWSENENDWFYYEIQLLSDRLIFPDIDLFAIIVASSGVYLSIFNGFIANSILLLDYKTYPLMPLRDIQFHKYEFVIKKFQSSNEHDLFVWIDGNYVNTYNLLNVEMERIRIEQGDSSNQAIGYIDNIYFGRIDNYSSEEINDFNFPVTLIRLYDPPGNFEGCYTEFEQSTTFEFDVNIGIGHNPQNAGNDPENPDKKLDPLCGDITFGVKAGIGIKKTITQSFHSSKSTNPNSNGIHNGDAFWVKKYSVDIDYYIFKLTNNYKIAGLSTVSNLQELPYDCKLNMTDFKDEFPDIKPPDPTIGLSNVVKTYKRISAGLGEQYKITLENHWDIGFNIKIPIPSLPGFAFSAGISYSHSSSKSLLVSIENGGTTSLKYYQCSYGNLVDGELNGEAVLKSQFMVIWFDEYIE